MIFKRIKLKNFKQYKDDVEFVFSVPENGENKITLFIGENGSGKTTLLQAVRYCFYGSSMYLNLPDSKNLLNHDLIDELNETDETNLYVEVEFLHKGIVYIARRERTFLKQYDKMVSIGSEGFDLAYLEDKKEGFYPISDMKKYDISVAMDKLREILPEGLSQVFMFDGERMEINISDNKFSKDLQESILGILGIKKYETLIRILGSPGKANTVLGLLNSKKRSNSPIDEIKITEFKKIQENLVIEEEKLAIIEEKITETLTKIELSKEDQRKIEESKELSIARSEKEALIKQIEEKVLIISKEYLQKSQKAIINKIILSRNQEIKDFLSKESAKSKYFDQLHIKTIEDIQGRGICICGRPISEHTEEYITLEDLKKTSLPIENAQHMNLVNEILNSAHEFEDDFEKLKDLRKQKILLEKDKKSIQSEVFLLSEKLMKIEKELGLSNQEEIEKLYERRIELEGQRTTTQEKIKMIERLIDKRKGEIEKIDLSVDYNQKINKVINTIEEIKISLIEEKNTLDKEARKLLKFNFNNSFNEVISGNYDVTIKEDYKIRIFDLDSEKDVTTVLSTGQNVVVSLSFIDALIKTAKEMSINVDKNTGYGVFMDAALSNLDEKHIDKLCKFNLNKMDQLIFLSFKKQLRDEMYNGIKNQIGKAYVIENSKKRGVTFKELSKLEIGKFIHETEGEADGTN